MTAKQLVWLRRLCQILFLLFFILLLIESRLPQDLYLDYTQAFDAAPDLRLEWPVTFFFQLDPLVFLSSLVAGAVWISGFGWAIAVIVLTILLGRWFCSFVCPFGTLHHAVSALKPSLKGEHLQRANRKTTSQRIKYFILIALAIAAVCGLNLIGWMDPIAWLFRSLALAVLPAIGNALRSLFEALGTSGMSLLNRLSYGAEELVAPYFGYDPQAYQTAWFIGLLFLLILFLNRIKPRFWCRVLCPLGALLGLCSCVNLLRLEKDLQKCTDCVLCTRHCQGAACPQPGEAWQSAECLVCFNCYHICPEDALAFRLKWQPRPNPKPDIGRRAVLTGLLAGFSLPALANLDGAIAKSSDPRLIRPPGALDERAFLELCQRCGLCMKACPTNVINPTLAEAGVGGFWTPHLIMTQGYCDYTCTLCGSVCPTGAIRAISAREKITRPIKIGSAYVDRGRCLPWSGNAPCIVCQEHCPTSPKAIFLQKEIVQGPDNQKLSVQLPYVDLKRCVGCGICENKCPVRGLPAIRTIAAGESRSKRNQILL